MTLEQRQTFTPPAYVLEVLYTLEQAGWEAWLVGGCVRDSLLGRPVQDYDAATNAPPERVLGLFPVVCPTGLAYGGVTVVLPGGRVEVTSYRTDQAYGDRRSTDAIRLGATIQEDAARRDFTIGALCWHPDRGLYDPTGQGLEDLEAGILRAVGDPRRRFQEDPLRILRGVRFAAQLGFRLEEETRQALGDCAPGLLRVSRERVTAEFLKLLTAPHPHQVALLGDCGALDLLFDTWLLPHQARDYTLAAQVPPTPALRLAAFCLGAGLPLPVLRRSLRLPKALGQEVTRLVDIGLHRPCGDPLWLGARLARYQPQTVAGALRLWQAAQGLDLSGALATLEQLVGEDAPCRVDQLAIGGRELLALGIPPRELGQHLGALAVLCLVNPALNTREALLAQAAALWQADTPGAETP